MWNHQGVGSCLGKAGNLRYQYLEEEGQPFSAVVAVISMVVVLALVVCL